MARREPDADVTSFGIVAAVLFLAGGVMAAVRFREPAAQLILVWTGGVLAFGLFFNAIQQWQGYGFRFYVLAAPWMAVVGVWAMAQLGRGWRIAVGGAVAVAAMSSAWFVLMNTHQIGWRAIVHPARSRGYFVYQNWRDWSQSLPAGPRALTVALPVNLPLAAFFRQPEGRRVVLAPEPPATIATASEFVSPDYSWSVVPAARFLGREGDVAVRTWLFKGEETSPFSLAAYRRLRPGETAAPVLYRHRVTADAREVAHDLLVKTGGAPAVRFSLRNPSQTLRTFLVLTPLGRSGGQVAAGTSVIVEVALTVATVSEVRIVFTPAGRNETRGTEPAVDLLSDAPIQ